MDNFNLKGTQTGRFTAKEPTFSVVEQQIMAAMLDQYGAEALLKLMGLPYTKVQDSSVPKEKVEMTVELLTEAASLISDRELVLGFFSLNPSQKQDMLKALGASPSMSLYKTKEFLFKTYHSDRRDELLKAWEQRNDN